MEHLDKSGITQAFILLHFSSYISIHYYSATLFSHSNTVQHVALSDLSGRNVCGLLRSSGRHATFTRRTLKFIFDASPIPFADPAGILRPLKCDLRSIEKNFKLTHLKLVSIDAELKKTCKSFQ